MRLAKLCAWAQTNNVRLAPVLFASELGEPVPSRADVRRFQVRRPDAFARWLLSFGGELRPVGPPEAVATFNRLVAETLALYGR